MLIGWMASQLLNRAVWPSTVDQALPTGADGKLRCRVVNVLGALKCNQNSLTSTSVK